MAKKQKRKVAANRPAARSRSEESVSVAPSPGASTSRSTASASASRSSYSQEFNPDYHLVIQDLKKIGIMAVSFIGLLVVLSFFLR